MTGVTASVGKTIAAAAALLAGSAAAAQAPVEKRPGAWCIGLQRVVEAARYERGFEALNEARGVPPRLGFFPGCQANGGAEGGSWFCHQQLAPETLSRDRLAAQTAHCLPQAKRTDIAGGGGTIFTLPGLRIYIEQSGGPGAHVGRVVTYVVEVVPLR